MEFIGIALFIFVIIVVLKIYYESDAFNLKCIVSDVDGQQYLILAFIST
mgnify:CR=1 FL=1